jgi:hypothetical protein
MNVPWEDVKADYARKDAEIAALKKRLTEKQVLTLDQYKIIGQINIAIQSLGGAMELLCLVGSFGQSQTDEDVLEMITQYNEDGTYMVKIIADIDDTPEIRRSRIELITKTTNNE